MVAASHRGHGLTVVVYIYIGVAATVLLSPTGVQITGLHLISQGDDGQEEGANRKPSLSKPKVTCELVKGTYRDCAVCSSCNGLKPADTE